MRPFRKHIGIVAPLDRSDVDTDQIVPKQFLKRVERAGFGEVLFNDWRFEPDGRERADFVLNQAPYRQATILVAGRNFGCGSSREHAPWALEDFGFRVVVAPSFADIFASNCMKIGLLPVVLADAIVERALEIAARRPGAEMTVDLERERVSMDGEIDVPFSVDPFARRRLLEGLDDIALTLRHEAAIVAYEAAAVSRDVATTVPRSSSP